MLLPDVMGDVKSIAKGIIGEKNKKYMQYFALRSKQALGRKPFTGLNGLDRKLLPFLPDRPGFFVEAGGNDGISQSNTYHLEACLGWRGFLVEPVHELAALARRFRTCNVHEHALGAPADEGTEITLSFSDLKSAVDGDNLVRWNGIFGRNPKSSTSTVITLSRLIEAEGNPDVDLFSLDVEGFELPALAGLDLERHKPRLILVETSDPAGVSSALSQRYTLKAQLSHHDYLFEYAGQS